MNIQPSDHLDDSCLKLPITSCARPPVPGKEDDWMPSDSCEPSPQSDIGGGVFGRGTKKKEGVLPRHLLQERTTVEGCLARSCVKNTNLETSGYGVPLGHEPDGSAGAAPCLKWAESLDNLLQDSDGVRLFKEFLDQENGCASNLDFWFACSGLKMVVPADSDRVLGLVRLIFKKYIKGNSLQLKSDVKRRIVERMKKNQVDQTVFDEAQAEIEASMRDDSYPLFLKSDTYLHYVQTGQESPKPNNNTSGGMEALYQPTGLGALPTLHEDEELAQEDLKDSSVSSLSLTPSTLLATRKAREGFPSTQYYGIAYPSGAGSRPRLFNPYHVSYAPVSAQDSELQSLSSDALTDDTMSYTDSSLDGRDHVGYKSKNLLRKQMKAMRLNAEANQDPGLQFDKQFIPRTMRVPPDCNLAETDPFGFASVLMEKLLKVKADQEKMDLLECSLKSIQDDDADDLPKSQHRVVELNSLHNNSCLPPGACNFSFTSMLFGSTVGTSDAEDNAQSILDDHVSHVWNSSGATPSRSPGFQTPDRPLLRGGGSSDLGRIPPGQIPVPLKPKDYGVSLHPTVLHSIHHKDNRLVPHDSGGIGGVSHKHAQRHHHYTSKEGIRLGHHPAFDTDLSQIQHSQTPARNSVPWTNAAIDCGKFAGPRKGVDVNSRIVEVGTERMPHVVEAGQNDTMKERVLLWMLDNEKYCGDGNKNRCSTDGSDKGSSSNKRSSHKSATKKNAHHKSFRSESLDRGRLMVNAGEMSLSCLPTGPVHHPRHAVNPDGFLVPPPPSALGSHFDEARNRLVQEARIASAKARGEQHSDPSCPFQPSAANIPFHNLSTNRSIPPQSTGSAFCRSSSEDLSLSSQKSDSKLVTRKKQSPVPPSAKNPTNAAPTVVGYYFCDEPIPYRTTLPGTSVTLGQFKQLLSKKGNYRYFFKKASNEFESGVVHEEITCDSDLLPLWEGKVVGKIERIH